MSRGRKAVLVMTMAAATTLATALPANASHDLPTHWDRTGPAGTTAVAQIYIEDHTGTRWPVNAASLEWNKSSRIGYYYASATGCNHSTLNCVPAQEGSYGPTGWYGRTTFSWNSTTNHIVRNSMTVQFNNSYATTTNQRRSIACHEEGHSIGVFDDSSRDTTSCMYGTDAAFPLYPNTHDYNVIAAIYNH